MDDLIPVSYDAGTRPTVSGRDLHEALGIETRYNDWFKRMCEYGFTEGEDFYSNLSKTPEGGRPSTDHYRYGKRTVHDSAHGAWAQIPAVFHSS